ncbi:uncharacterized protein LOC134707857 [Mytilus trossulus]|uniref:uncharacterized protein LOC134707857 n=1 Tax=Mytilus trossulus TaxID=6551 RepID=UPI0030071FD1
MQRGMICKDLYGRLVIDRNNVIELKMPSCYARPTTKTTDQSNTIISPGNMNPNENIDVMDSNINYSNVISNSTNFSISQLRNGNTDSLSRINGSYTNGTFSGDKYEDSFLFREFGMIRLAVLGIVIMVLILSTCKIVFKMFSRSLHNKRDDE